MHYISIKPLHKYAQGFTLVELVIVIVLLGILSIGVTSFIRFGSDMFVDTKNRSDMVATGRFVTERLNRELRSALPNSVIVQGDGNVQCIEYIPIITTVNYLDIPTLSANEGEAKIVSVVKFDDSEIPENENYTIAVYPSSNNYDYTVEGDKVKNISNIIIDKSSTNNQWDITFDNNVRFSVDSPTSRLYFINEKVSYCVFAKNLKRFEGNDPFDGGNSILFFNNVDNGVLMANNLLEKYFPFTLSQPTQFRNATVLIRLVLEVNQEEVVFNNEVHIPNAP